MISIFEIIFIFNFIMEIRISVFKFLEILAEFSKRISDKVKLGYSMLNTPNSTGNKLIDINEMQNNFSYQNNQIYNFNNSDNIFSKEFNNFYLLKNENKKQVSNHIDIKSELYYIYSNNLSRYDVINRQINFYEIFSKWQDNLKANIDEKLKEFLARGIDIIASTNKNYKYLNFNTKSEFEQFIRVNGKLNLPVESLATEKYLYKFLKELYVCMKLNRSLIRSDFFETEIIVNELEERMNLIFHDIGMRNSFEEDFELHRAVYDNNLRMIRKICAQEISSHLYCEINELDPHGNTPLMLAIKLKNLDAINVLCDHDADIKHKCYEGDISPLEYASSIKNKEILKILINGVKKQKISNWENNKKEILNLINNIPDFSMELKLNYDSNIFSLFSSITSSDTYKFYKSGGNIRIDLNIGSMNSSFKSIRGKCSIIVQEKGNKINVFKVDHEKKICYDYIDYLGNSNNDDEKVERIIYNGVNTKKIITRNFRYVQEKQKKVEKILNYYGQKYSIKGDIYLRKKNKKEKNSINVTNKCKEELDDEYFLDLKKCRTTFSMYFKDGLEKKQKYDSHEYNHEKLENNLKEHNILNTNRINMDRDVNKIKLIKVKSTELLKELNYPKDDSKEKIIYNEKHDNKPKIKDTITSASEDLKNFKKKQIEMSIWISESFPIKISHFIPLIHILSLTSSEFAELKSAVCSDFLPFNSFPLKFCFPLGFSFYALLSVVAFKNEAPPDSIFDLPYGEKDNRKYNNYDNDPVHNGNIQFLNENYATEFYDRYYHEQNLHNGCYDDPLENSDSSNFHRLRDLFLTNHDDEKLNENIATDFNLENNLHDTKEVKSDYILIENIEESKSQNDNIQYNLNENERNYVKVFEIGKKSCPISPLSNSITNINFTDVNFGFFNGVLNFENGAVIENNFDNKFFNNNQIEIHRVNTNKEFSNLKEANEESYRRKDYSNMSCILNSPRQISLDKFLEYFNKDFKIPNEKIENINIKIPATPKRIKFKNFHPETNVIKNSIKFCCNQTKFNKCPNKKIKINESTNTIKLDFQPKISKQVFNICKLKNNKYKKIIIEDISDSLSNSSSSEFLKNDAENLDFTLEMNHEKENKILNIADFNDILKKRKITDRKRDELEKIGMPIKNEVTLAENSKSSKFKSCVII